MCIYNRLIKNRKYTKNKKNDGNVPTLPDRRVEYVPIGCGNCMECRKQKANEWRVRLLEDIKHNTNAKFITLTFSNESIQKIIEETITRTDKTTGRKIQCKIKDLHGYDRDNKIATKAIRIFNEEWRAKYKKAIRHWLITELGHNGTENIHLHGLLWTNESYETIRQLWKYGYIWPRPETKIKTWVNGQTINYMMKYVMKTDEKHKEYKSIILTSPGIGRNYINTPAAERNMTKLTETYKTSTGHEIALPTYWRNKLFTDEDRERLWIQRLDKMERYVDGQKISIANGEEQYNKLIKEARRKNAILGYGNLPNDNRKEYEEQLRDILIQTRIKNTMPAGGG